MEAERERERELHGGREREREGWKDGLIWRERRKGRELLGGDCVLCRKSECDSKFLN
jgi:hypothetical protein